MNRPLLKHEQGPVVIDEGDAAIVLKADGSFRVIQRHNDFDPDRMTARQIEQGMAIMAFAFMLTEPQLMDIVAGLASERPAISRRSLN